MGYGWGQVGPDGASTTWQEAQRINAGWFQKPMVAGIVGEGLVVTGLATMSYRVSTGSMYMPTDQNMGTIFGVAGGDFPTVPAPGSGSRIDYIWVDGGGQIRVTQTPPTGGGVEIDRRTVPAGITGTVGTTSTFDRPYKVLSGSPMGVIAAGNLPTANDQVVPASMVLFDQDVYLPIDQTLEFAVTQCLYAGAGGEGSVFYTLWMDNVVVRRFKMAYSSVADDRFMAVLFSAAAGRRRLRVVMEHATGLQPSAVAGGDRGPTAAWVTSKGGRA